MLDRLNFPNALALAPMEGVADYVMRDVLTSIGGYDFAFSEFVSVVDNLLPKRNYKRICPEIGNDNRTANGTPVIVQLLGGSAHWLAENAARLAECSRYGVDLNFGCPARCVNRRGAGAILLDDPDEAGRIAEAVRRAVPADIPVSAKMRLGVSDTSRTLACARALAASVDFLAVHARTREESYRPPAHWEWVAKINEAVSVPVIANGEVWTVDDWRRCRETSCTDAVMLGRGAVSDPFLALRIRGKMAELPSSEDWLTLQPSLLRFWHLTQQRTTAKYAPGRLKMWLKLLRRTWPDEAGVLYEQIRQLISPEQVTQRLERT